MKYWGREIDPIKLWEEYVDFPHNLKIDGKYLPKVVCPNPEHDTNKHHFQINVEDGLVHCFAQCGISGTFTKAIALLEGCNEREARKRILRLAGTHGREVGGKLQKRRRQATDRVRPESEIPRKDELTYSRNIPQFGSRYLEQRGISPSSIAQFEIGWDAEDRRIVIPGKDERGQTRLLIKRAVREQDWPKYLYTEGFPKTSLLFGACHLDLGLVKSEGIVLVEGSFDTIVFQQFGIPTVGVLGTGISRIQSEIVARLRPRYVYLAFDRDTSGIHGIEIAVRRLRKEALRVCRYPRGKFDPAELNEEEAYRSISRAVPVRKVLARIPEREKEIGKDKAKVSSSYR